MQRADIPAKFRIPFAESAGGSFRRAVPSDSQIGIQDGAASYTTGFPPVNFTPLAAGGVPPFGADVNGILFQMSGWDRWFFSGGPVAYDGAFSADIGGYPQGAVVASVSTLGRFYLCLVDDNLTDPDVGGAGWKAFAFNTSVNGQCYFQYVSPTTAKLVPRGGAAIVIAGVPHQIPAAGVTVDLTNCMIGGVAAQAAAASTVYNAYLVDIAGTLTIDFWTGATSGHVADTTAGNVGVEVRNDSGTPDSTRTLIGKVATDGSSHISQQGKDIISWFNRVPLAVSIQGTGLLTSNIAPLAELSPSMRVPFLAWTADLISATVIATVLTTVPEGQVTAVPNLNGALNGIEMTESIANPSAKANISNTLSGNTSEGLNYATVFAFVSSGSSGFFSQIGLLVNCQG